MKASDISDEEFLCALNARGWTQMWDLTERLPYPIKVIRAKARTMIRKRKYIVGCYCGCRGDFELTLMGHFYILVKKGKLTHEYLATDY